MKYPIFLLGFMASGKSSKGKKLSQGLDIPFYDLDEEIVRREGKTINDIFEEKGEVYFRTKEAAVLRSYKQGDKAVIALGGGTPRFHNNMEFINRIGTSIYLKSSANRILGRLRQKKSERPLVANLTDEELKSFIESKLAERAVYYEKAKFIVETDDLKTTHLIKQIKEILSTN